ncbi:MAG: hypothetical protein HC901_01795 [Bdellovibrionaceae bacterium]|nr:hypothetical protein [Pseudobdellovibrionaceae bacterium]
MSTHPPHPQHCPPPRRLWIDGVHQFQKIGKPLRNYADATEVDELIDDLPVLREKNYTCLELNCYWHHFDHTGRGEISVSLDPLRRLITAIRDNGLYPSLSVETYGVAGASFPRRSGNSTLAPPPSIPMATPSRTPSTAS